MLFCIDDDSFALLVGGDCHISRCVWVGCSTLVFICVVASVSVWPCGAHLLFGSSSGVPCELLSEEEVLCLWTFVRIPVLLLLFFCFLLSPRLCTENESLSCSPGISQIHAKRHVGPIPGFGLVVTD